MGEYDGLPSMDDKVVKDVLLELSIRKHIDGNGYVKSKYIAGELGIKTKLVMNVFRVLEENGKLEQWGANSSNGTTYRILL